MSKALARIVAFGLLMPVVAAGGGDPAVNAVKRGEAAAKHKNWDLAIEECSRAIRRDPKLAPAYYGRGSVYVEKGEWDKAIADFTKAIKLDPKDPLAYDGRAT